MRVAGGPGFRSCLLTGAILLLAGCTADENDVDAFPFGGLVQCGDAPFVAVFSGVTAESLATPKPGDSASSNVYGIRPDGSVEPVTTDMGTYRFGIAADASTLYATPYPTLLSVGSVEPVWVDSVVTIDLRTGFRSVLAEGPAFEDVLPSPDGSRLAVTIPVPTDQPGYSNVRIAFLDTDGPGRLGDVGGFDLPPGRTVSGLVWDPDGQSLAYTNLYLDGGYDVWTVDATTGKDRVVHQGEGRVGGFHSLAWSPDGGHLLAVESGLRADDDRLLERVIEIDVASGASSVVLEGDVGQVVYSAQGGSTVTRLINGPTGSRGAESDERARAQTWTRGEGGTFTLTSESEIGADLGLLSGSRLDIPACALG